MGVAATEGGRRLWVGDPDGWRGPWRQGHPREGDMGPGSCFPARSGRSSQGFCLQRDAQGGVRDGASGSGENPGGPFLLLPLFPHFDASLFLLEREAGPGDGWRAAEASAVSCPLASWQPDEGHSSPGLLSADTRSRFCCCGSEGRAAPRPCRVRPCVPRGSPAFPPAAL